MKHFINAKNYSMAVVIMPGVRMEHEELQIYCLNLFW
jgi:hypothetical protein